MIETHKKSPYKIPCCCCYPTAVDIVLFKGLPRYDGECCTDMMVSAVQVASYPDMMMSTYHEERY
jgi:hypothetical protein